MKNSPLPYHCEFCLKRIGLFASRFESEHRKRHKQLMEAHQPECTNWNNNAAKVMKL